MDYNIYTNMKKNIYTKEELIELELLLKEEPIEKFRRLLSIDMLDKLKFVKLQNILKVLPEICEMAKKN
jgi:hypothetical protein